MASHMGFSSRILHHVEDTLHNSSVLEVRWTPGDTKLPAPVHRNPAEIDARGWLEAWLFCKRDSNSPSWKSFVQQLRVYISKFEVQFVIVESPEYHFVFTKADTHYND